MAIDTAPLSSPIVAGVGLYFDPLGRVLNLTTGAYEAWNESHYTNYRVAGVQRGTTSGLWDVTRPAGVGSSYAFQFRVAGDGTPSGEPPVWYATEGDGSIPDPAVPQTVTAFLYTRGPSGDIQPGLTLLYRLVAPPLGGNGAWNTHTHEVGSDADGLARFPAAVGGTYQYWIGDGPMKTVSIPADAPSPYELPLTTSL